MTSSVKTLRWALLIVTVAVLLPAGIASATSCEGECQGTNCIGGCIVNSPTCATSCVHDGCPGMAVCKEHGGESHTCNHEAIGKCSLDQNSTPPDGPEQQPLSYGPVVRDTEWSVVAYESDGLSQLAEAGVDVLATSNRFHADRTIDELMARQREESARLRQRVRQEGLRIDDGRAVQRRLLYSVAPAGRCARAEMEMDERQFGSEIPRNATIFVRATIDARGEIVELLHSDRTSGAQQAMVDHLKANGRMSRTDGQTGPHEAYVVLFSDAGHAAGWIVFGSNVLL